MSNGLIISRVSAFAAVAVVVALSASAQSADPPPLTPDIYSALSQPAITVPDAPQLGRPPRAIASYDGSEPANTFVLHWRPPATAHLPTKGRVLKYIVRKTGKPYSDDHDPAGCGTPPGNDYETDPNFARIVAADVFSLTVTALANEDCLSWAVAAVNAKGEGAALYTDPVVSTRRLHNNKDCAPGTARPWGGMETRQPADPPQSANPPIGPFVSGGEDDALKAGPQLIDEESSPYNEYRRACASGHHVEYGDWCHRLNYPRRRRRTENQRQSRVVAVRRRANRCRPKWAALRLVLLHRRKRLDKMGGLSRAPGRWNSVSSGGIQSLRRPRA